MACIERSFFGVPIVAEAPVDLPDVWGCSRERPGILVFARLAMLWRLARSPWVARALTAAGDAAVVPVGGGARCQVALATGCRAGVFSPFHEPIRILSRAEVDNAGVFIVDVSPAAVRRIEENVKVTFPGLRVVGRAAFTPAIAASVTTAIRKSDPRIVLVGSTRRSLLRWIVEYHEADAVGNVLSLVAEGAAARMAGKGNGIGLGQVVMVPLWPVLVPVLLIHRLILARRRRKSKA